MQTRVGRKVNQVTLCSWQLEAVGGTCAEWQAVRPRRSGDSLAVPGVYVYWGRQSGSQQLSVYAGQTDALSFRLTNHHKACPWFQYAIGVFSSSSPLNRSLLRALEVEIVGALHEHSTREFLDVCTALQRLPISVERFLGSELHGVAAGLAAGMRELIATCALALDVADGQRLGRALGAPSSER
jgi:hypothetical protein